MNIVRFGKELLGGKNICIRKKEKNTSFPLCHWHSYYEMIFYKNCRGSYNLNGRDYDITDDCVFFVTPIDFHKISTEFSENSFSVNISFMPNIVEKQLLSEISFEPFVCRNIPEKIQKYIMDITDVYNEEGKYFDVKIKSLFNLLLSEILIYRSVSLYSSDKINPYVQESIIAISNDPGKNHTLESVAVNLGIAPNYFSKLFHETTGTTFKDYLNNVRIDYAKRLLEETEMSATTVGLESGYQTSSHFFRVFRKYTVTSPEKYRDNFFKH